MSSHFNEEKRKGGSCECIAAFDMETCVRDMYVSHLSIIIKGVAKCPVCLVMQIRVCVE